MHWSRTTGACTLWLGSTGCLEARLLHVGRIYVCIENVYLKLSFYSSLLFGPVESVSIVAFPVMKKLFHENNKYQFGLICKGVPVQIQILINHRRGFFFGIWCSFFNEVGRSFETFSSIIAHFLRQFRDLWKLITMFMAKLAVVQQLRPVVDYV